MSCTDRPSTTALDRMPRVASPPHPAPNPPGRIGPRTALRTARILPLLMLALAGCATGPRPDAGSAAADLDRSADAEMTHYRNAITALNDSRLELAQSELDRLTRIRPELAGPWLNLAIIAVRQNDLDAARMHLDAAQKRNPGMPQVHNLRGYIELSQGNVNKASDAFRQAITLREDYAMAHYNYALVHDIYFQDFAVAVRHYRRYLELTANQDTRTAEWVTELERQLSQAQSQ